MSYIANYPSEMDKLNKVYTDELVITVYDLGKNFTTKNADIDYKANEMDSLFYYFAEKETGISNDRGDEDDECVTSLKSSDLAAAMIAELLDTNRLTTSVNMAIGRPWSKVRDNTFTIQVGINNTNKLVDELAKKHSASTLFFSVIEGPQQRNFVDINQLIELINNQDEVILKNLNENVEQMDAMRFLMDKPDTVYTNGLTIKLDPNEELAFDGGDPDGIEKPDYAKQYYGYSNWYIKAKYLSKELHQVFPRNFNNIVITGASKLIATDVLKVTKLQQYLAACGRFDTKIILVE